jgi:methionyl-tRNA formyltransferase
MSNRLRIVFMGTPEFAVESLRALVEAGEQIVGVITAPDKPKGRGQKVIPSPVKEYALQHNLHILQPTNLKDEAFLKELKALQADIQVVVAFRMLPELVWNMPPKGTFNLHASLLPAYRGAAPINWAIINGEKETGITTFFLKHEIDTGAIIFQEKEAISESDTVGDLYERLMHKGAQLVVRTIQAISAGDVPTIEQGPMPEGKHAPKIFKDDCKINWEQPAVNIYNFIRGLSPYPAAWTELYWQHYKIYKASITTLQDEDLEPGEISTDNKSFLHIQTADFLLSIEELQPEGKKRMDIKSFFNGYQL